MLIFDAHLDLGLNAVDWNRDLRMTVAEIRAAEKALGMTEPGRGTNTVSFPELRRAEVGVGVATVLARIETPINHPFGYTTPEACYAIAMAHLAYYRGMERGGAMKMIRTREDLNEHAAACGADPSGTPFGFVLSMECGDPVLDPDQILEWHEHGLRAIGITHYGPNRYGGGTRSEVGLAAEALPLLEEYRAARHRARLDPPLRPRVPGRSPTGSVAGSWPATRMPASSATGNDSSATIRSGTSSTATASWASPSTPSCSSPAGSEA